jgi:subtilisin family serine protease
MSAKIDAQLQLILAAGVKSPRLGRAARAAIAADNRIMVTVNYEGHVAPLRAAGLETGSDSGTAVIGLIAPENVARLAALPNVFRIYIEQPDRILLDNTVAEMRVPWKDPLSTWTGKGAKVIVAVVDTGIDIFHDSFRKSDGTTRILELWDQGITVAGRPPPPAPLIQAGAVFNAAQINAALTAGVPFASRDTNGHGTHVAGIAAGNGRQDDRCTFPGAFIGVAPEADLVIVRAIALPPGVVPPSPRDRIEDALIWCAAAGSRHLDSNGRPKRVVINCSFGRDLGPHDGTGSRDVQIARILRPGAGIPQGLAIVAAAGNEGADQQHESGVIPANGTVTIPFMVPDGSSTADALEIWYNGTASLTVQFTAPPNPAVPGTNTTGPIPPGAPGSPFTIGLMSLAVSSFVSPIAANNNKKLITLTITPNAGRTVRSGPWQMILTETAGVQAVWDAWWAGSRTDSAPTFKMPSENTLVARRRLNTMGEPATALDVISVGSYDDRGGNLAESSSRGVVPVVGTPIGEVKPTVAAPGVGVKAPRSRDDPDDPSSCCDQRHIDKAGTSMASPHVAGLVALIFEKNRNLTFEQVRAHLQKAARTDGIPAPDQPVPFGDPLVGIKHSPLWGSGKVDAARTLNDIPEALSDRRGGGGAGGGPGPISITLDEFEWGYTPHNFISRLGDWKSRFGEGPGLMLVASLISEHVDEVLRLLNANRKIGTVWKRHGGPKLVRHLLDGIAPETPFPVHIQGCDVPLLLTKLLPVLNRYGSARIRSDIARYGPFAMAWPGAPSKFLDATAREVLSQ